MPVLEPGAARAFAAEPSGALKGKDALRSYWTKALQPCYSVER
jgi:hypothetical protein